jgi:hypothetical protein
LPAFQGECIFFSLLDKDIFEFEIAMYDFVAVDNLHASKNLIENVECLFEREDFIIEFALDGIEVAHITILHD